MGIFISVPKTIECVCAAVVFALLYCGCFYKLLGILQSLGYNGGKFSAWVKKKGNLAFGKHVLLMLLCALSSAVISLCFGFTGEWAAVIGLSAFVIFFIVFIWADNKVALKVPVAFTPRLKRLYTVLVLISAILVYFVITLLNFADFVWGNSVFSTLRYVPLSVFPVLIIPIMLLSNAVAKIYEIPHNKSFVKKARIKLGNSNLKIIAITGSYGKTSTKRILSDILSKKYRVLSTPRSYNTPMGIALSVNSANPEDYDIFIAEMGARHSGDIAELCELCPPEYAVITGICPQHIETFKTVENIVKAKGEILSGCKKAFISADCIDLFKDYNCTKIVPDCVKDIVSDCTGSTFTLVFGNESVKTHTKLLGRHSVENIALAAQIAYDMGMSAEEIAEAVKDVEYIEHRLQLIESQGVNILDDGYNSNVKGAAAAVEVLKSFKGRKIAVTPGLVELGLLEESGNKLLGAELAGLDYVILVGETLVLPVKTGYSEAGGDLEKLVIVPTLDRAQEVLKGYLSAGDTVLFLNDLPDIYN